MYTEVQHNFIQNMCSYTDSLLMWGNSICGTLWLVRNNISYKHKNTTQSSELSEQTDSLEIRKYNMNTENGMWPLLKIQSPLEMIQKRMAEMLWSSAPLRILGCLINNVNGICQHFKVIKASVSGAGRGLFKLKDNADVRVAEGKMISNKFNQD